MKTTERLMRLNLPYGKRTYANGAEELFNRNYDVIGRNGPEDSAEIVSQEFFYSDRNPPWIDGRTKEKCERIAWEWVNRP